MAFALLLGSVLQVTGFVMWLRFTCNAACLLSLSHQSALWDPDPGWVVHWVVPEDAVWAAKPAPFWPEWPLLPMWWPGSLRLWLLPLQQEGRKPSQSVGPWILWGARLHSRSLSELLWYWLLSVSPSQVAFPLPISVPIQVPGTALPFS